MTCTLSIFLGSVMRIELLGLKDLDGNPIDSAIVEFELRDEDGNLVEILGAFTWPIILDPDPLNDGDYFAEASTNDFDVVEGQLVEGVWAVFISGFEVARFYAKTVVLKQPAP